MSKKIMIIDDSNTMRKIISRSLRQAGLEFEKIMEASDGQVALDLLSQEKPDIILSDINMPNMDGIEFLKQKAANDDIKDIPVIMITTESASDVISEAISLGAKGSIKKPFTPAQIESTVGSLL